MLNTLVDLSLRYKLLTLVAFAVIAFLGWRAVNTVPIDAFPDLTPIQVNVYTESPGLAAEDVEELLTFPVESGMAGLTGVQQNSLSQSLWAVLRVGLLRRRYGHLFCTSFGDGAPAGSR